MDIQIGDRVYWKLRIGSFLRTLGGKVLEIKDDIATVEVHTQNIFGKEYHVQVGSLTKNKKQ